MRDDCEPFDSGPPAPMGYVTPTRRKRRTRLRRKAKRAWQVDTRFTEVMLWFRSLRREGQKRVLHTMKLILETHARPRRTRRKHS